MFRNCLLNEGFDKSKRIIHTAFLRFVQRKVRCQELFFEWHSCAEAILFFELLTPANFPAHSVAGASWTTSTLMSAAGPSPNAGHGQPNTWPRNAQNCTTLPFQTCRISCMISCRIISRIIFMFGIRTCEK